MKRFFGIPTKPHWVVAPEPFPYFWEFLHVCICVFFNVYHFVTVYTSMFTPQCLHCKHLGANSWYLFLSSLVVALCLMNVVKVRQLVDFGPWGMGMVVAGCQIITYLMSFNPRQWRGVDATPPWVAHQTVWSIMLKFSIADGSSFAQLLVKKNWSGQVRSRSYDVTMGTTFGKISAKSWVNATWRGANWLEWG